MGRRIQVTAMAAIVAFALLADVVSAQRKDETVDILLPSQVGNGKPPCCNECVCTRSIPPICRCTDRSDFECHNDCEDCVQLPIKIYPPKFVCDDWFEGYCTPCVE